MPEFTVTGDTLMHAGREYAAGRVVDLDPDLGAALVSKGRVVPVEAEKPKAAAKPAAKRSKAKPDTTEE